jgi:DNA-binding NarL/FixJ family response regulator
LFKPAFKLAVNRTSTRLPRPADALNSRFPYNEGMKSKTVSILVLEPHPLMRESLCIAIAAEPDLEVVLPSASDTDVFQLNLAGQDDALFLSRKPDIILLALGNPGREDLQALVELRNIWPETLVLALTSSEVPGQEQEALDYGAQAALTKAASRGELLQTLRSLKQDAKHAHPDE